MAALHTATFHGTARWSVASFAVLLADPAVFAFGDEDAFAVGRVIADEAELLTLVTARACRRQGRARNLIAAFDSQARDRGAARAFLEVAEDNVAARALYSAGGWREAGRRRGYYAGIDAVILRKDL